MSLEGPRIRGVKGSSENNCPFLSLKKWDIRHCFSVPPAIRSVLWNSGSGFVKKSSRLYRTVISFLAYPRSSGDTSSEPVPDLIRESGPPDLPEMFRKDESNQRDRGRGCHPPACPFMAWIGYEPLKVEIVIMILIGYQWQWRAGKKDPQAPGFMGSESKAATQSHLSACEHAQAGRASKGPRIQHRLFPPLNAFPSSI